MKKDNINEEQIKEVTGGAQRSRRTVTCPFCHSKRCYVSKYIMRDNQRVRVFTCPDCGKEFD